MIRTVILHGRLRKLAPEGVKVEARTIEDAILGLSQILRDELEPRPGRPPQAVQVIGCRVDQDFYDPLPDSRTEIHLVPSFHGGKSGGFVQILFGALLIIMSFIPGLQPIAGLLFSMGLGMMMGGVLAVLSPAPKAGEMGMISTSSSAGPAPSLTLGKPRNTAKIGTRIPVVYGKYRIFGQILSSDIQAAEVAV